MIKTVSECFVKPKCAPDNAKKPVHLTPCDLSLLSVHYNQKGLLFAKPSPLTSFISILTKLRESLSETLVHFYTLSGQLETKVDEDENTSVIFINPSKGPGARFIHASALELTVTDILSPIDVPKVVHSFFDLNEVAINYDGHTRPLLSVQVTELYDGVFIGCTINHLCVDGRSHWHFFSVWSEIFQSYHKGIEVKSYPISRPPIQERWVIDQSQQLIKLPFTNPLEFISRVNPLPTLRERIFHFSAESVSQIKARANLDLGENNNLISSLQALLTLTWRGITRARRLPYNQETKCVVAVDIRVRLDPPLSQDHVGSYIQYVKGVCKAGELLEQNLGWGALMLNRAVAAYGDKAVRDTVQKWINSPFIIQLPGAGGAEDSGFVRIGSSPRFDIYGNEFGMGKALAVLSGNGNKFDGKVIAYPGRDGDGSIDLEICLLPDSMKTLESDEEFMAACF